MNDDEIENILKLLNGTNDEDVKLAVGIFNEHYSGVQTDESRQKLKKLLKDTGWHNSVGWEFRKRRPSVNGVYARMRQLTNTIIEDDYYYIYLI